MMWPAAAAANILAPASAAPVIAMYKFYKSGAKTEVPDHISPYPPGGGAPLHLQEDRARPDLAPAVVDKILNLVNAHLDAFRNFKNPAGDIVDKVEKLWSEAETETETESPTIVQGTRIDHALSDLDPTTLDEIRRLDPAVLDEILGQIRNQNARSFPPGECWTYLRTGTCKNRSSCKFKHPPRSKDKQYYLRPGGCKHGKACRYIHSREKTTVAPVVDTNFAGLPIRPGEKECAYYMRHGECKYASNCRFSHPDPVAEGGSDPSSALQGASEATCSAPRSLNETPPYVPMWNGNQSPSRSMPARPPYVMNNNSMTESNIYKQYPYLNQVEEFPERPGQPVCSYFLRTGDCKFRSSCKYHHPKIQTAVLP